jgi:hypothetical protein
VNEFQGYDSLEERRKSLFQAMRGGNPGRAGGRKALPLFGGMGRRSGSLTELPMAPLPQLTFNPFMAQMSQGLKNLAPPSIVNLPQPPINDNTGTPPGPGPAPAPTSPLVPSGPPPSTFVNPAAQGYQAYNYDPEMDVFRGSRMSAAPRRLFGGG